MTTKMIIIFFLIFKKYSPKEFNKERLPTGKQDIPELQFKHLYGSRPAWPSCRNEDMDLNHQRQPDQPWGPWEPTAAGAPRSRAETIRERCLSGYRPARRVTQQQREECDSGRTKAAEAQKDKGKWRRHFFSVGK